MTDSPIWPLRWPYFRFAAILITLGAFGYFVHLWRQRAPLLQAFYLSSYIRTALPPIPFWNQYTVVMNGKEMALPDDQGTFYAKSVKLSSESFNSWLKTEIYDNRPLYSVLRWPLIGFGCIFVLLLYFGGKLDRSVNSEARDGRLIRGPKIISHWRWNLRTIGKPRHFYIETR